MGPRLFRRGNKCNVRVFDHLVEHASMGPRLFRRGNVGVGGSPFFSYVASMGPRLFRRGNPCCFRRKAPTRPCFNGSTSFQTWKFNAVSVRACEERFSFNGSTSFQTWKCVIMFPVGHFITGASMGPRLFRRGNVPAGHSRRSSPRCFNGSTSFQTWK